jgi:hypothetical protein
MTAHTNPMVCDSPNHAARYHNVGFSLGINFCSDSWRELIRYWVLLVIWLVTT